MANRSDPAWRDTYENIKWSMITGHANAGGRAKMLEALSKASMNYMGMFKDGFYETQDDDGPRALFESCCRQDEREVYNMGRELNGQPRI